MRPLLARGRHDIDMGLEHQRRRITTTAQPRDQARPRRIRRDERRLKACSREQF
jgi:hypothetical protein